MYFIFTEKTLKSNRMRKTNRMYNYSYWTNSKGRKCKEVSSLFKIIIIEKEKKEEKNLKNNIILIGFMGCGKTTVGTALAEKLEYKLLDTDAVIVEKEGKSINAIFAENGEEYFRNIETKTLEEMEQTLEKAVISTGGGLVLRECNGAILKNLGFVVFLKVEKETVLKRLAGDDTRPLLKGDNVEEKVENLLEYRNPIYEYTAHVVVETDDKTVEEIIEEIIRNYKILTTV